MDEPPSRTDDAEKRLRETEVRYQSLFDSMSEGFCIIEKIATLAGEPSDFEFLVANPAFAAETGVDGVVGKTIRSAFPGEPQERAELLAHGVSEAGAQITLDGPNDVALRSATVQPLAMALHELATNAIKHGALSQPQAHLTVCWQRVAPAEPGGQRWLLIDWRETGVDMSVHATRGSGAGRELIEHAIPHQLRAETRYVLSNDGVHCTMVLPD